MVLAKLSGAQRPGHILLDTRFLVHINALSPGNMILSIQLLHMVWKHKWVNYQRLTVLATESWLQVS